MSEGFRLGVGSVGGLLILFGLFLISWRRADHPGAGARTRTGVWLILVAGAVLLAAALALTTVPGPEVPSFLTR
jgi:nitrate reductase gamma subunit